jgi:4-oxalocrotonate tautomerase
MASHEERTTRVGVCREGCKKQKEVRIMPLVQIHAIKGVFSPEAKKQLIEKVTEAMVQVEGENLRRVTVVTINEVNSGDWGIGGKPLTTEAVMEMASDCQAA